MRVATSTPLPSTRPSNIRHMTRSPDAADWPWASYLLTERRVVGLALASFDRRLVVDAVRAGVEALLLLGQATVPPVARRQAIDITCPAASACTRCAVPRRPICAITASISPGLMWVMCTSTLPASCASS